MALACEEAEIPRRRVMIDCGRKEYGGLTSDPDGTTKDPERGTARSRRRVADLQLEKQRLPWPLPCRSLATGLVQ